MLFDPYGRELKEAPKKPVTEMIGSIRVRDQYSSYPSVKLTPEKLSSIFKEADAGDIIRQAELFEEMEEKDPILGSVMHTRKLAVQGLDYEIQPFSESAEDKKIADYVRENFADFDLEDVILDLMDVVGKGIAVSEIQWNNTSKGSWVAGFEWIHQKRLTFAEMSVGWDTPLPKVPKLLTDAEPIRGVDIPPFKILYHRYKARSGFAQRAGLFRSVAYYYLFKNYDIKDWIIFLEKFGQPMRVGKFTPGASADDIKVLKEAIQNLGTDAAALISDTTLIEIIEAKMAATSGDLYERAAKYFDRVYEIAVLGQTATTEGTPGKLGSDQAQTEVRADLERADAKALAKTLRQQLIWPMVGFNFGWDKPLPKIHFIAEEPEDLQSLSTTYNNLVQAGTPIPVSHVQKKFGIPAPQNGEEILTPPAITPPVQGFNNLAVGAYGNTPVLKKKVLIPVGSRLLSSD